MVPFTFDAVAVETFISRAHFVRRARKQRQSAYNPPIPDGGNSKATCLIEYEDPVERAQHPAELKGIEDLIGAQVGDAPR